MGTMVASTMPLSSLFPTSWFGNGAARFTTYEPRLPAHASFLGAFDHSPDMSAFHSEELAPFPPPRDAVPVIVLPVRSGTFFLERFVRSIDFPVQRLVIVQDGFDAPVAASIEALRTELSGNDGEDGGIPVRSLEHYVSRQRMGCAEGWNSALRMSSNEHVWLIANFDMAFPPGQLRVFYHAVLDKGVQAPNAASVGIMSPYCRNLGRFCYYSFFAVTRATLLDVGLFDENIFPAYYEDDDFRVRVELTGRHQLDVPEAELIHGVEDEGYHSGTMSLDAGEFHAMYERADTKGYFQSKWGFDKPKLDEATHDIIIPPEGFRTPYNGPFSVTYWRFNPRLRLCQQTGDGVAGIPPKCDAYIDTAWFAAEEQRGPVS